MVQYIVDYLRKITTKDVQIFKSHLTQCSLEQKNLDLKTYFSKFPLFFHWFISVMVKQDIRRLGKKQFNEIQLLQKTTA